MMADSPSDGVETWLEDNIRQQRRGFNIFWNGIPFFVFEMKVRRSSSTKYDNGRCHRKRIRPQVDRRQPSSCCRMDGAMGREGCGGVSKSPGVQKARAASSVSYQVAVKPS
jgi:hypothetical protein